MRKTDFETMLMNMSPRRFAGESFQSLGKVLEAHTAQGLVGEKYLESRDWQRFSLLFSGN